MATHPMRDNLYQDPALAQFYDLDNRWGVDLDYCRRLADDARSVLDLGCGRGALSSLLIQGSNTRSVLGLDVDVDKISFQKRLYASVNWNLIPLTYYFFFLSLCHSCKSSWCRCVQVQTNRELVRK